MSQPIKRMDDINKIKAYLRSSNKRNYLLFIMGINTGIKSNQMLNLKLNDVLNNNGFIKKSIFIVEKEYPINTVINKAIKEYLTEQNLNLNSYLFRSQKSNLPINRSQLYKILNKVVKECNINIHIGNETLRKTFGYHYYYKTKNVKYLKKIFNKHSIKTLFNYLEIDDFNDKDDKKEFIL